jgi:hypothetical protein
MKTGREKAEEKRQAKLAQVQEQVEEGSLVIRQMTEEERRKYPPRPERPRGAGTPRLRACPRRARGEVIKTVLRMPM